MDLTPDYSVRVEGAEVAGRLQAALAELVVVRGTERATDSVEIVLGDAAGDFAAPPAGRELAVRMGYAESGLVEMGTYWHSETDLEFAPARRLTIRATGADLRAGSALKAPRTRAWRATTVGGIVQQIAADHGHSASVDAALAALAVADEAQTAESDLHFLRRLAQRYDATARAVGQRILFVRAGASASASGQPMPAVTVSPDAPPIAGRVAYRERPRYGAVRASWLDTAGGAPATVTAGGGDPTMDLPDPYPTRAEAEAAAASRLSELARQAATLELDLPGNPSLAGGGEIVTSGWGSPADGRWSITRATHRITPAGYTTEVMASPLTSSDPVALP